MTKQATRFVKSTPAAHAKNGTWRGLVRFEVYADDVKNTRMIKAVSGRNLEQLSGVKPIVISAEEWKSSPECPYDGLVEWVWLVDKFGMTTEINR